jgi:hypothetical protein
MYKCYACGKQFQEGERVSNEEIWRQYTLCKRTYKELSELHNCSISTIQRHLNAVNHDFTPQYPSSAVVLIDTTYFGRTDGVMLFQDAMNGIILQRKYVRYETNAEYLDGLAGMKQHGTEIIAVICDGRKGLLSSITHSPVQMCQFHMQQIIRRLLTKNPHLIAGRELYDMCRKMKIMGKTTFMMCFENWCFRWQKFMNERTTLVSGKTTYTHRKLRVARRSILEHLPWLFTYEDCPRLGIPNTSNMLEGTNSQMKRCLRNHNGLTKEHRNMYLDGFLETWKRDSVK